MDKDGVLIAGAWYLGPAASTSKVVSGAVISAIANGTYQWYDLSKPDNENKSWDYWGSASAGITGAAELKVRCERLAEINIPLKVAKFTVPLH